MFPVPSYLRWLMGLLRPRLPPDGNLTMLGTGTPERTYVVEGNFIIEKTGLVGQAFAKVEVMDEEAGEGLWPTCPWENGEEARGSPMCPLHDLVEAAVEEGAGGDVERYDDMASI